MFGNLMDDGLGRLHQATQLGQIVGDLLPVLQHVGKES